MRVSASPHHGDRSLLLTGDIHNIESMSDAPSKHTDEQQGPGDAGQPPAVVFLCVHNAGRSQMAAGWLRHLAGESVDVFSGGSEPASDINEVAVEAMAEVGIDIGAESPQAWSDETIRGADVVVTMGCGDACPVYPGKRYEDWDLSDPAGQPIDVVRGVRDEIEQRVRDLMAGLNLPADG